MAGDNSERVASRRTTSTFYRGVKRTLGVRLAGAVLATIGVALMGIGTVASPVTPFAKAKPVAVADPGCDGTKYVCVNESFEGKTAAQALSGGVALECLLGIATPGVDQWVFVLPNHGIQPAPQFTPGTFNASFSTLPTAVPGQVGLGGNNSNMFATVVTPAGLMLLEAQSQATSGSTAVVGQDFQLTGVCPGTPPPSSTTSSSTSTSKSTSSSSSATSSTPGSSTTSSSSSTTSVPGSTTSTHSTSTTTAGVLGTSTSTPGAGADIAFGAGLMLLAGGGGLFFAARRRRRKL